MRIWKNFLGSDGEDKIHITEIAGWDFGSNSNGYFFKHPTGILVQFGQVTLASGSVARYFDFPKSYAFTEIATGVGGVHNNIGELSKISIGSSLTQFRLYSAQTLNNPLTVNWWAIGLWK